MSDAESVGDRQPPVCDYVGTRDVGLTGTIPRDDADSGSRPDHVSTAKLKLIIFSRPVLMRYSPPQPISRGGEAQGHAPGPSWDVRIRTRPSVPLARLTLPLFHTAVSLYSSRKCTEVSPVPRVVPLPSFADELNTGLQSTGPEGGAQRCWQPNCRCCPNSPRDPQSQPRAVARTGRRIAFLSDVFLDLHAVCSCPQSGLTTLVRSRRDSVQTRFAVARLSEQSSPQRFTSCSSTLANRLPRDQGTTDRLACHRWLEYETVFPPTPDPPRYAGATSVTGTYSGPFRGPGLSDLLTREAPTVSTAAALRFGGASGMRNSQLQERFDRLEEIIEQLGGRESLELSRSNTQDFGSGDEAARGGWCQSGRASGRENPMSPSDVSAVAEEGAEKQGAPLEGEVQLIDSLAQLRKCEVPCAASNLGHAGLEGRKQQ